MRSTALHGAGRLRRLAPYHAAMVCGLLLIPVTPGESWTSLNLLAGSLAVALLVATWLTPWSRLPAWAEALPFYLILPVIGLLRHANGGSTSGYAPLAMLPILWLALYAGRRELLCGLAVLFATFVAPLLLTHAGLYPAGSWRLAVLLVVTAAVIGFTTRDLTQQLRERVVDLAAIGRMARDLPSDERARTAVCAAAREVSGATWALLLEPTDGARRLVSTASEGIEFEVSIPVGKEVSAAVTAFLSGRAFLVTDCAESPAVNQRLVATTGVVSLLLQPVLRDGVALGVLALGFEQRLRTMTARLTETVEVIAAEAALALERADLLGRLALAAHTDGLTGAVNRRGWDLAVDRDLTHGGAGESVVALVDLDHFKAYNDTHGHQAGDLVLQRCVNAWRAQLRRGDTLARWGGEEFAVLLPHCGRAAADAVLDRLRRAVPAGCTASLGAVVCPALADPETTMEQVDAALYEAKHSGRNQLVWHRPASDSLSTLPAMESDLVR